MYEKLKDIRNEKGLTLLQMSQALGYSSPNAYARKEKGERKFTLDEVEIISNIFGLTVEEIFFNDKLPKVGNK
jgi:putative transcriptional regulator